MGENVRMVSRTIPMTLEERLNDFRAEFLNGVVSVD